MRATAFIRWLLVLAGMGTPEVFELVVRAMAQAGRETLAEVIINECFMRPQL